MIPREVVAMMARRRLVAEVRTETAVQAIGAMEALVAGGIGTIEVSLSIPGAQEILTHFASRTDVIVGAGAVLDGRQATEAISCGARFITSPILVPDLLPICREANIACVLGALTPTEIIGAQRIGAEMVKLYPVEAMGGPLYVRALFQQLTHMSLQVAGGITAETLGGYLALPVRTIALGSVLVSRALVERGSWQALTNRARAFVDYTNNPHEYAARFLAMMGVVQRPQIPPPPAAGPAPMGQPAPVASVPGSAPGSDPSSFKPWGSRPTGSTDEEEGWIR